MDFVYPAIMYSTLYEDNNGDPGLSTSPKITPWTRHIDVKYHFLREHGGKGKGIVIHRVEYKYQKAGVFNKWLSTEKFYSIRRLILRMVIVVIKKEGKDKKESIIFVLFFVPVCYG